MYAGIKFCHQCSVSYCTTMHKQNMQNVNALYKRFFADSVERKKKVHMIHLFNSNTFKYIVCRISQNLCFSFSHITDQ